MSFRDLTESIVCPEDLTSIDENSHSYIFTKNLFVSSICLGKSKQDNSADRVKIVDYVNCMNDNMNDGKMLNLEINREIYSTFKHTPPTNFLLDLLKSDLETYDISQRFQMKKECYDIASKTKKDLYLVSDKIVEPIKPHEFCDRLF